MVSLLAIFLGLNKAKEGGIERKTLDSEQKKSFAEAKDCFYLAGAERLELPTPGFGDRCSTN